MIEKKKIGKSADKAVSNHKNFYTCSSAVLCAFHEALGLPEEEAKRVAAPFAGGRMGKCGAVMAAEYVLKHVYGNDDVETKISEFEKRFIDREKGSVMCNDLRGQVPGSCRACVTDAALILEEML